MSVSTYIVILGTRRCINTLDGLWSAAQKVHLWHYIAIYITGTGTEGKGRGEEKRGRGEGKGKGEREGRSGRGEGDGGTGGRKGKGRRGEKIRMDGWEEGTDQRYMAENMSYLFAK